MSLLKLMKTKDDALAAYASATSQTARAKALVQLEAAADAVATFKAKSKSFVKKEERYEEEDSEESVSGSSESEEEKDEPKKPLSEKKKAKDESDDESSASSASSESSASESESESESESMSESESSSDSSSTESSMTGTDEDEEKAAAAELGQKGGLYSHDRLFKLAQAVTGKRDVQSVFGALDGLGLRLKAAEALEGRIAVLEGDKRTGKVTAMLDAAMRAGKVTVKMLPALRATGLRSTKELAGLLDVMPKLVRTRDEGGSEGRSLAGGMDGDAPKAGAGGGDGRNPGLRGKVLDAQSLSAEERECIEQMSADTGKTFDEFFAAMNETTKRAGARRSRTNGAA